MWIEIGSPGYNRKDLVVTPYAGVWIEIVIPTFHCQSVSSLPTRECGLKYSGAHRPLTRSKVTPYAGVWIEIVLINGEYVTATGHSLRGSVD